MANKLARYKQPYFLDNVQEWWDQPTTEHNRKFDDLYMSYIERQVRTLEYEAIIHIDEFKKCLYALGIVSVSYEVTKPMFKQLSDWRPSENQVLRYA